MNDASSIIAASKELDRAAANLRLVEQLEGRDSFNYDSYCEEMQGALESYDEAIRKTI